MFKLFTDSDTDITLEEAKYYGYEMISMPYVINDKVVYPYKDFEVFNDHEFYDILRGGVLPTTSALNIQEYIDYFEPVFAAGYDILYVHFSSAMTATFGFMQQALNELKEKYPERKFYEIDTLAITLGSYLQVIEIGEMYKNGASLEEILAYGNENIQHTACYFFVDDLKFFKKSGRVNGLAAVMGGLIGIKPIISINEKGVMGSIDKVRGKLAAVQYLVDVIKRDGLDLENHTIVIGHTDILEYAEELQSILKQEFGDKIKTKIIAANPTAGSHCGPNCVGVVFHATHR